jgi:hypothetical protein
MNAWLLHGLLAAIAWAVLVPLSIMVSLLRDRLPPPPPWHRDSNPEGSKAWVKLHRYLTETCTLLTVVSFSIAVQMVNKTGGKHFHNNHERMGLVVLVSLPLLWIPGRLLMPPKQRRTATEEAIESTSLMHGVESIGVPQATQQRTKVPLIWAHRITGLAFAVLALWEVHTGLHLEARYQHLNGVYSKLLWIWIGALILVAGTMRLR